MLRARRAFRAFVGIFLLAVSSLVGGSPKFRADDPLMKDPDQMAIPRPTPAEVSQIFDFLESTFAHRPTKESGSIMSAVNVNTLGEVPDSSWFTNRIGRRALSLEELARGPNRIAGPDQSGPWLVVGVKTEGVTPGLVVRDGRDDLYFVKFDPPKNPHLTTSAEVIATKFFHAFGYNVPENYLAFIRRRDLIVSQDEGHCSEQCEIRGHQHERAVFVDDEGKERLLEERDIDKIFERYFSADDRRIPVVASRRLGGIPLGPFKYFGTRSDDPNDVFPHEDRRELRGLRVFSSWLNHDDSRSINSLDMYVGEPGKGHVQHHLIDFGSTLGSGSVKVQSQRGGNEYILEWRPLLKAGLSLGIWDRSWRKVKYPDYPSIGRFEGDFFQPQLWKPEYPNPAFDRMLPEDAFWATKILMRFNDERIRAIVETGMIPDSEAADYLVSTLIKRRDRIVAHYLALINPLADFRLTDNRLDFSNLGVDAGLAASASYDYEWFRFENVGGGLQPLTKLASLAQTSLAIPPDEADHLMVRIRSRNPERAGWRKAVEVYLDLSSGTPRIVGIERES